MTQSVPPSGDAKWLIRLRKQIRIFSAAAIGLRRWKIAGLSFGVFPTLVQFPGPRKISLTSACAEAAVPRGSFVGTHRRR